MLRTKAVAFAAGALLAVFAAYASASSQTAQTPRSTNPAVQQLRRWLVAYDDTNWNVYREFLKTNFAPEANNILQESSIRDQTGPFDLIRIENETPTKVTALLNGRDSDKIGQIVVEVEAVEPHRILKLQARAIARPPELPLPHLNEKELIASLRKRLQEAVSRVASTRKVTRSIDVVCGSRRGVLRQV